MSSKSVSRRKFMTCAATASAAFASIANPLTSLSAAQKIPGFDETDTNVDPNAAWEPFTDRKLRMGIVGFGLCQFGAQFGLQDHPNVEVVAVSDLFPDRCAGLAKACRCEKTYPSLEEMIKDDSIEAIFIATDAPSHADHVIKSLKVGKHVASAVPAVFGNVETHIAFMKRSRRQGFLRNVRDKALSTTTYSKRAESTRRAGLDKWLHGREYYHYGVGTLDGYKNWRRGLPPQWYPTHSNAYYTCVTGGSFTKVSCVGHRSKLEEYQKDANPFDNPFGTEIALFTTSEGGSARMAVSWDTAGWGGETGRMRGEIGAFNSSTKDSTTRRNRRGTWRFA